MDIAYLNAYNTPEVPSTFDGVSQNMNGGYLPATMLSPVNCPTSDPNSLAPHIKELVDTHGCIRQNIRCARQLQTYWVPTLPRELRGCNIEMVMRECLRLGRRTYVGREERRLADDKWQSFCAAREGKERWHAYRAAMAKECATTPTTGASAGLAPVSPLRPPSPLPPPPAAKLQQIRAPPLTTPPPAPHLQPILRHLQLPNCMRERQMYIVMAAYDELQQFNVDIVGVIGNAQASYV